MLIRVECESYIPHGLGKVKASLFIRSLVRTKASSHLIAALVRCFDRKRIVVDAEYCRDLGHAAVRFLVAGGGNAMISVQGGRLVPIPFDDLVEPETGKTKVRLVNVNSEGFRVARAYMIRLEADDFAHAAWVDRLADAAHLTPGAFRQRFEYLATT